MKPALQNTTQRIGDEAVKTKTGKVWEEWFVILDQAGAARMNHRQIVAHLVFNHGLGPWWQQMVAVAYEQERGLRDKHQRPDGYQVGGSRVIQVPVAKLFKAFSDANVRQRWLRVESIVIRKTTLNKSIRMTCSDGKTLVSANFYAKGTGKSQVALEHSKLSSSTEAARMKAHWAKALDTLKDFLERS
jgi:uncharacterized protein YndB with AHSA1/START domain